MKKIKILTIAVLGFCFALASCENFFDVQLDDQATIEEIFAKSETCKQYLSHLYSFIPEEEEIVNFHGWVVPRSDEAIFSWYQWVNYNLYKTGNYSSATPSNRRYFNYWPEFYTGINQCSTFLEYVDLNKEDTEAVIIYMKAEARFLRAYFYFCLFRQYGPVYIWGDRMSDELAMGESIDRHTVEQNIDFIISELERAAEDLPLNVGDVEQEQRWMGRATRGAALALKSRVLLYAASPLFNGCDLYKGQMMNLYGDYLFPQSADDTKWELAARAAKDVIDMNMYSLYVDNTQSDPFRRAAASYQGVMFEPWNSETIWGWWWRTSEVYNYMGTVGSMILPALPPGLGFYGNGFGGIAPSIKLVDSYPMWNTGRYPVTGYQGRNDMSRPIVDPSSGYVATGFTNGYAQPLVDDWAPTIKAHNSTIGRDPRFYACVVPNGFYWPNRNMAKMFTCYNGNDATSRWDISGDCVRSGYAWRRLYKDDTNFTTYDDYKALNYVYPAFRLAEIYLNYAEACNEKPQRDEAEAIRYLNLVRNRAGLNDIQVAYPEITGNKELLRWCIRKERMVEFGMEAMRHYDACRWMIAKDEYPGPNYSLRLSADNYEDSWERVSDDILIAPAVFRDKDYLFPISSLQLAEMTNLTQNLGH